MLFTEMICITRLLENIHNVLTVSVPDGLKLRHSHPCMYFSSPITVPDVSFYLRNLHTVQKMVSHKSLVCPIIHAVSTYYKNVLIPCGFEAVFNQMVCIVGGVGILYIHTVWGIGS